MNDDDVLEPHRNNPIVKKKMIAFLDKTIGDTASQLRYLVVQDWQPPHNIARWIVVDESGQRLDIRLDFVTPGKFITTKTFGNFEGDVFVAHWRQNFRSIGKALGMPASLLDGLLPQGITTASDTGAAEPQPLTYIEQKIKEAVENLRSERLAPTDENVAARLPTSQKGEPYVRESVNRLRNAMRKRGEDV